jgi:hypothetical protein
MTTVNKVTVGATASAETRPGRNRNSKARKQQVINAAQNMLKPIVQQVCAARSGTALIAAPPPGHC